ncbi:MAG TPA: bifunctional phosphoribosyl-AMP cyclohydrolase/phosphoribosyl-ATP diphosphatase HisIE [Candidatus Methylomirabilis sp.]|jgi:phosphoribosyl-ATP pyrophosphohydrolase/phosphoribosyl-AMP cyclohydrolase
MANGGVELKFNSEGLIPAVAQDRGNGQVLMLAYINREALDKTRSTGFAHYYSRSRGRLWKKGEESGHVQRVHEILYDCDADALVLKVDQEAAACHTGNRSCFYRALDGEPVPEVEEAVGVLGEIYHTIRDRKVNPPEGSYVAGLLAKAPNAVLKKIGEEAAEVVMAGKEGDRRAIVFEVADLWFHTLVLLGLHDIDPAEVARELRGRIGKRRQP